MTISRLLLGRRAVSLLKAISLTLSVQQPIGRMTPHVVDLAHHEHYTEKLHVWGFQWDWDQL